MGLFIGLSLVLTPAFLMYASFKFPVLEKPGWVLVGVTQIAVLIAYITLKNVQPLVAKGFKLVLYFLLAGFVFGGIAACGYFFYGALTAVRPH